MISNGSMQHHHTLPDEEGRKMDNSHWSIEPAIMALEDLGQFDGNQDISIYMSTTMR